MLLKKLFKKITLRKNAGQPETACQRQFYHENFIDEGEQMQRVIFFKMIQLIDTEMLFLDPHLTITQIADKVGTNTGYITKVIQLYTPEAGFCELINKRRINFSKTMLSGRKKIPLHKIALKSGYSSAAAFQYNFKKFEKMSPGVWREQNKVR